MINVNEEVLEFYNSGAEIGRLERGIGKIEYERTMGNFGIWVTK